MFKKIRKDVVSTILGTDNAEHFQLVINIESMIEEKIEINNKENKLIHKLNEKENMQLKQILIHASDFTGCSKPYKISK